MALPLFFAVYSNDTIGASVALTGDVNVNQQVASGMTALHIAAERGFAGMVGVLLGCHASPDSQDDMGYTPLMNAAVASDLGHIAVVERLLLAGSDINLANHSGATALHLAASLGNNEIAIVLLNSGANPSLRNNAGETPLDLCVQKGLTETVRVLLQYYPAHIDLMEKFTDNSQTLLQKALSSGKVCICSLLVNAGYRIHSELYNINQFRNSEPQNTEVIEWLKEELQQTQSLQQLCRVFIRKSTSPRINSNVTELGLPTKLQHYICFQDI